jgi:8-oxo-dGTP pyrophosphatase MutT (NUDIX family)
MTYPFDNDFRQLMSVRYGAFNRLPETNSAVPLKHAAVAIALVEAEDLADGAAFLLTKRTSKLRAHSGQWALPGGRCDQGENAIEAALRELDEELGLRLKPESVLGILDDYATRSGYLITPVVVWGGKDVSLRPNPDEVASVHRILLRDIAVEDAVSFEAIPESDRMVVRMRINGGLVNAPTAALIYQFREVLAGRETRVADYEQPVFAWR